MLARDGIWVTDFDDDADIRGVYFADLVFDLLDFDSDASDFGL